MKFDPGDKLRRVRLPDGGHSRTVHRVRTDAVAGPQYILQVVPSGTRSDWLSADYVEDAYELVPPELKFKVGDKLTIAGWDAAHRPAHEVTCISADHKVYVLKGAHTGKLRVKPREVVEESYQLHVPTLVPGADAPHPTPSPRSDLKWIGVDLDGTIAKPVWTPENPTHEIGEPIWENVAKLREAVAAGFKPVIHTSRAWTDYETIETWLNHYAIPFKQIQCGKPLYRAYADDRGVHASAANYHGEGAHCGTCSCSPSSPN